MDMTIVDTEKQTEISRSKRHYSVARAMSSQFSSGEIASIIVAWAVLSVAITYQNFLGLLTGAGSSEVVIAGFTATATGFILHEMGHKFVAIRRGYLAHFRLWIWGLVLTLSIVTLSGGGILFGAPGAVYIAPAAAQIYGYDSGRGPTDPEEDNMIISAAGPGINLAFAAGFLVMRLRFPNGFLSTIADFGLLLNVGLGSFNMLPISLLDGAKIFRKSLPLGLAIALPLWAMFIIFNFIA
jgi:Zn-dependent protease